MEFVSHRDARGAIADPARCLRVSRRSDGALIDAWLSEGASAVTAVRDGALELRLGDEGVFGRITRALPRDGGSVRDAARALHADLLAALARRGLHLARTWSTRPEHAASDFEHGRAEVFAGRFLPPDTALGTRDALLSVELFATPTAPLPVEALRSPAAFAARGAIVAHRGERLLFAAATAGSDGDLRRQLRLAIQNLRVLCSQFNLKPHGIEYGFGLEDLVSLRVHHRRCDDRATVERVAARYVDPDCHLAILDGALAPGVEIALEGVFRKKGEYGEYGDPSRAKYYLEDGRIRVESLEVHVAEHCNITCRGCDAMSPFNDERFLSVAEVERVLGRMTPLLRADIFKLMGGEPLLHPRLVEILRAVRRSGITRVIRLTTNGLLLHAMGDDFWRGLDRLTVSNYASAPIPPAQIERIEEKAEEFDVVLNLKRIDQFNLIELTEPLVDERAIKANYDDCWIRHRSLIVRDGVFFKCTRAAYLDDFRARLHLPTRPGDAASYRVTDGIPIDADDFQARALAYLNHARPLESCTYCLGAAGRLVPHTQLGRREVARLLRRT